MNCMTFDIETVPDTDLGARVLGLEGIAPEDVARAMGFHSMQERGTDFLPLYQHRVVAISVTLRRGADFRVWTLGDEDSSEAEIVQRFFDGIEKYTPELVS